MIALIIKEWKDFWSNSFSLISVGVIILLTFLFLWIFPDSSYATYGYAEGDLYFVFMSYLLLFIVPAFAVGFLASEYRYGTEELIRSLGIRWSRALLAKFIAALLVLILILFLTYTHLWVIGDLEIVDKGSGLQQTLSSYTGLLGIGGVYIAVSLMITSYARQTTASYLISVFICFMMYIGISWIGALDIFSADLQYGIERWSLSYHADQLARGILRLSSIIYVSALIIWSLWMAAYRLKTREI